MRDSYRIRSMSVIVIILAYKQQPSSITHRIWAVNTTMAKGFPRTLQYAALIHPTIAVYRTKIEAPERSALLLKWQQFLCAFTSSAIRTFPCISSPGMGYRNSAQYSPLTSMLTLVFTGTGKLLAISDTHAITTYFLNLEVFPSWRWCRNCPKEDLKSRKLAAMQWCWRRLRSPHRPCRPPGSPQYSERINTCDGSAKVSTTIPKLFETDVATASYIGTALF